MIFNVFIYIYFLAEKMFTCGLAYRTEPLFIITIAAIIHEEVRLGLWCIAIARN